MRILWANWRVAVQAYASTDGGNGQRVNSGTGSTGTTFAVSPLSSAPSWSKTGTTSTWTVRDPDGTLIAVRIGTSPTSATEYYPFTDNVQSVRTVVKADGTVSDSYSYSAYGSVVSISEATGASQPYRYGGGYTDTVTGLIQLGIRYYDPTQAWFTQQDPTRQDPQYIYSRNCPATFNDPTGALSASCELDIAEAGINSARLREDLSGLLEATVADGIGVGEVIQALLAIDFIARSPLGVYEVSEAVTECSNK